MNDLGVFDLSRCCCHRSSKGRNVMRFAALKWFQLSGNRISKALCEVLAWFLTMVLWTAGGLLVGKSYQRMLEIALTKYVDYRKQL